MTETGFETLEDGGTYHLQGQVAVIALVDRRTLKLKGYVGQAFLSEADAQEFLDRHDEDPCLAYIIQEKEFTFPIHRADD